MMNPSSYDRVELVDESGVAIGSAPKLDVHHTGQLHRAISVFLFDERGNQLIHQRAHSKYHSPGMWSNACCSHPMPGENPLQAANRRLLEEIGITAELRPAFVMRYHAEVGDGLVEHEFDHVFLGTTHAEPVLNPAEVAEFAWISPTGLQDAIRSNPARFTPWFKLGLGKVYEAVGQPFDSSSLTVDRVFDRVDFLDVE
jgi:isopentenyl-diphosphate delta-isomerase